MNATDRFLHLPQQSQELERAILGAVIASPTNLREALILLRAGEAAFYAPQHRHIYHAIRTLNAQGSSVDYITLMQQLAQQGKILAAGGAEYVRSLVCQPPLQ